jgi:hypothetical protein
VQRIFGKMTVHDTPLKKLRSNKTFFAAVPFSLQTIEARRIWGKGLASFSLPEPG